MTAKIVLDYHYNVYYIHSMKKILISKIPEGLHQAFKIMCVEKNISMNAELLRLIKDEVGKYRKKEKK